MSTISFKLRKYDRTIDSSFWLYNDRCMEKADWHIGDTVDVIFTVTGEQSKAIKHEGFDNIFVVDGKVFIPCTVISRRHAVFWKEAGKLHVLNQCNVTLQAETGEWEDILEWVTVGKKPDWAK